MQNPFIFLHAHFKSFHYGGSDIQLRAHTGKRKNITVFLKKQESMNIWQLRRTVADKGPLEFERLH